MTLLRNHLSPPVELKVLEEHYSTAVASNITKKVIGKRPSPRRSFTAAIVDGNRCSASWVGRQWSKFKGPCLDDTYDANEIFLLPRHRMMIQLLLSMLIVGWTIALVLMVYFPRFLQRPLPSSPNKIAKKKKRILLLVAHPDDECMFFGPTLLSMTMQPTSFELRVLCISTGNADGLGERRKLEMLASCTVLKVPAENVEVLDHPALQDGHQQAWNQQLLVEIIDQTMKSQEIDIVITFDNYGVSGHPNHIALSCALRAYLRDFKLFQSDADVVPHVECWELVSLNIARKYSGVLEICVSTLGWLMSKEKSRNHCFLTPNPLVSMAAMEQHESQWVWFRRLFVVFAAYTYVNLLRKIESPSQKSLQKAK